MKITRIPTGFLAHLIYEKGAEAELCFEKVENKDGGLFRFTAFPYWGDPVELYFTGSELHLFRNNLNKSLIVRIDGPESMGFSLDLSFSDEPRYNISFEKIRSDEGEEFKLIAWPKVGDPVECLLTASNINAMQRALKYVVSSYTKAEKEAENGEKNK